MAEEAPQGGGTPPEQPTAAADAAPAAAPAPEAAPVEAAAPAPAETAAPTPTTVPEPVAAAASEPITAAAPAPAPADAADNPFGGLDQTSIDELLRQASFDDPGSAAAMAAIQGESQEMPDTSPIDLPNFNQVMRDAQASSIDLLRDVDLNVKIELGRSRMLVEDVLKLGEGSVVELDKLAGDPVDVFVNDRLVARGEVLVLNDNFCVRINEIVAGVKEEGM